MFLNELKLNDIDSRAISLYINKLRENGIKCDMKIFDEDDFYTIYLTDKKEYEKRDIINIVSYNIHTRFEDELYKTIHCEYLYDWFEDESSILLARSNDEIRDITAYFNNVDLKILDGELYKIDVLNYNTIDIHFKLVSRHISLNISKHKNEIMNNTIDTTERFDSMIENDYINKEINCYGNEQAA